MNHNIYKDDNMEKEIVKSVVEMSAYVFERGLVSGKAGNVSARFKGEKGDIVAIPIHHMQQDLHFLPRK